MKIGDKVKYIGCSEEQCRWGNNDDPALYLLVGGTVTISTIELHSWHTKLYFREIPGKYNSVCFEPVAILTLPEEKKNTMEISEFKCMTCGTAITKGEYDTFGVCDACYDANYKKQTASGSVAAPKEESLIDLIGSHRLSYTFEEDGETGLSLLDRLTPLGYHDVSRGNDEIQLLAEEIEVHYSKELASLRQQLKEREEALKELLPIAERKFNSISIDDAASHREYIALKVIIERACKLLSK